jgi:flagellar motility protein MotE (MotC chaperone)
MSNKSLSREEAAELYQDLQKAMGSIKSKKVVGPRQVEAPLSADLSEAITRGSIPAINPRAIMTFVLLLAIGRATLTGLDAIGVTSVDEAMASGAPTSKVQVSLQDGLSRDEVRILTSLDSRRAELEERSKAQEVKARELSIQEKEIESKLMELKSIAQRIGDDRTKTDVKRSAQIEQLANVYGSMGPSEAAALIEQLDISISLELIARMPEKRIGQILSLMTKEKALEITKLLSNSRK